MKKPLEGRLSIDLPDLRRRGFFNRRTLGSIEWQIGGQLVASVTIAVRFDPTNPPAGGTLTIRYTYAEHEIMQTIRLTYSPSNLGRGGGIWYAVCPAIGRRCRTLYYGQHGFVSRYAEGGLRYQAQLLSHSERANSAGLHQLDQLKRWLASMEWFTKPHSKHSYRGKPTRPMARHAKLNSRLAGKSSTG